MFCQEILTSASWFHAWARALRSAGWFSGSFLPFSRLTAAPAPFSVQARSFLNLDAHGNPRPIKEASYRRVLRKMFMGHRGFDNKNRQTSYNETSVVQMEMTDGLQAVAEAHAPHDDEHALSGKQSPAPHGDEETGTRDLAASQSSV